ncbi:MAG TPA: HEAT repeat domain-containing protein [Vicinamibacterales bacterium]|nr:HEAT repeat domain-containing protein [Vicinamibacterales bacterium]
MPTRTGSRFRLFGFSSFFFLIVLSACASAPPVVVPERRPQFTFEEKMGWILRLEEDRVLQSIAPAAPALPQQPDLIFLLRDQEARIRRRAALAIGRTRLSAGVDPLRKVLSSDPDPEVRQMAAFAMGLIGNASAADALLAALSDPDPLVQGRAAEGLGLLGHKPAATAIAAMMSAHTKAGVLSGIAPDDLDYPKPSPVEAVRLGLYALVRLSAIDPLLSVVTDASGQPISRWWPIAYAFRRINDPKAGPVLLALLDGQGAVTRAFAARGLGVIKEARAIPPLVAVISDDREPINVRIEAARAVAELGAAEAVPALAKILTSPKLDANLRLEAVTALGQLRAPSATELFVDLMTERWPTMRAAALTALARTDPDMFMTALSGLDPDPHWSVRAALATALGTLDAERAHPRLTLMLEDADQRVVPAALAALVATSAADAEDIMLDQLGADDPVVRQAAAAGLAKLKSRRGADALTAAYDRAGTDQTYVARAAMLAALVDLDPAAARPILTRALADRDWATRVRAAALLRTVDPTADVSAIRPAPAAGPAELNELTAMINPTVSPVAYIDTEKGMIQIELAVLDAPRAVANFISLTRRNFLGATPFHRVVPNFVAQDGDPRGDGEGGPGYTIRDEINQRPYLRGTVGVALDWEDTGGSQFFITHSPQPHLDGRYTVFGRVISGMEVVDRLTQWDQIRTVRVWDGVNWIGGEKK